MDSYERMVCKSHARAGGEYVVRSTYYYYGVRTATYNDTKDTPGFCRTD